MDSFKSREELINGRSADVAKNTAKEIRELLSKHRDLVAQMIEDEIVRREVDAAVKKYRELREKGERNDNYSRAPGFTLYVTNNSKNQILKVCRDGGFPISDEQVKNVGEDLWSMRLPEGTYGAGGGGIQFYQVGGSNPGELRYPFSTGYRNVVRIVGDSGELWQNSRLEWDGTEIDR